MIYENALNYYLLSNKLLVVTGIKRLFQELKSEEHVLSLVFCLNYFGYSQSVGRWVW